MATKKKATKKPPQLQQVEQPLSPLEELQKQSFLISNIRAKPPCEMTIQDCLEEMMKALAPLRYLHDATYEIDELEIFMVQGYLSLFLRHMDELLLFTGGVVRRAEQKGQAA